MQQEKIKIFKIKTDHEKDKKIIDENKNKNKNKPKRIKKYEFKDDGKNDTFECPKTKKIA